MKNFWTGNAEIHAFYETVRNIDTRVKAEIRKSKYRTLYESGFTTNLYSKESLQFLKEKNFINQQEYETLSKYETHLAYLWKEAIAEKLYKEQGKDYSEGVNS